MEVEYKEITVSKNLELQWQEGYEKFGWHLEKEADCAGQKVELRFCRDRNLPKKNELNRLQNYFENTMGELEHMEQTRIRTVYAGCSASGILGALLLAFAVIAVLSGRIWTGIGFAVPGVLAWVVGAVLYYLVRGRQEKEITRNYIQKTKQLDDICYEAYHLL